ncbi:flagellar basal body P-ring formation chaperone FlgA [Eionea flava]
MKSRNFLYNFLWFFSFLFLSYGAQAKDNSYMSHIVASAKTYLEGVIEKQASSTSNKQVSVSSFSIDSRLQLKPCDKPLTFSHNLHTKISGVTSVKASCQGSHPWSIYTKHRVSAKKWVVTLNKSLPRHHIIRQDDIGLTSQDTRQLRNGYIADKSLVVGQKLKRSVKEGAPIYHHQLAAPNIIKKGDKVNIAAKVGSLTVVTSGIALDNGRKGDQIDVENLRSSRVIRTRVMSKNNVEVIL